MLFFRKIIFAGNAKEIHQRLTEIGIPEINLETGKKLNLKQRKRLLEMEMAVMEREGIDPVTRNVKKNNT